MNTISKYLLREKLISFLRENGVLLVLLFLYVSIHGFWEDIIANQFVDRFLKDYFSANWYNDIIFYLAVLGCLILFLFNWRRRYKSKTIIICITALLFWIYYRFVSTRFGLLSVDFNPVISLFDIKYIDIVPIFAGCILLSALLWKVVHSDIRFLGKEGFIRDVPIEDKLDKSDILRRDELAENAVKRLLLTDTSNGSFTYGIDGPWGAGKSSLMNIMKKKVSDTKGTIAIDFNPWIYAAETDLVLVFMEELSKHLKIYDQSLAKNLIEYSKLISAFDPTVTKLVGSFIELSKNKTTLLAKKEQVSRAIKAISIQIFVFIDDLDRLDANELMEMMKLIRNVSDFPYMYFVAAYDKTYLVPCLESRMGTKGAMFVEKIFQHEIHLSAVPKEILRKLLFNYLNNYHIESNDLEEYIINNDDPNNPLNALSNIREIKRLTNSFISSFANVRYDIDAIDLLLFELFKMKFPLVFTLFERNIDKFLILDDDKIHFWLYKDGGNLDEENEYSGHLDFLHFIKKNSKEYNISEIDLKSIETILYRLFGSENLNCSEFRSYRRFNDKRWINRFIHQTELETDISEKEFLDVLKTDDFAQIEKIIDEWSKSKPYALGQRLIGCQSKDKNGQLNLIRIMVDYLPKINSMNPNVIIIAMARLKVFNANQEFTDDDKEFINSELKKINNKDMKCCRFIAHLYKNGNHIETTFSNAVIEIQKVLFDDCISKYNYINEVLLCFCDLLGIDYYKKPELKPYLSDMYAKTLIESMRHFAEAHIIELIPNLICVNKTYYFNIAEALDDPDNYSIDIETLENLVRTDPFTYEIRYFTEYIWGSWTDFYYFIYRLNDDINHVIPEFKEFLDDFKSYGYDRISYPVNHKKPIILYKK